MAARTRLTPLTVASAESNFDWQRAYFYEQPIPASLDDVIEVTCEWTTLDDEVPIRPGFGTEDEMCLLGLMVVPR